MDIERFFRPKSAAFVGATEDVRKFGGRCFRRMVDFGYGGRIYPVNPKYSEIFGTTCYPSVSALSEIPDHVGIVVPAAHVAGVLRECVACNVPFATIYTSGFRETGSAAGAALEAEIRDIVQSSNIRVMGPNCNGFVSFVHGFCMTTTAALTGPRKPAGDIGIIAQSGGLGQINVMFRAHELGLGVSHQVSCGNQVDLDVLDFAQFMVDDPHTSVILMAVESIGDGAKLASVARHAAEREKPIVILKMGRTEAGQRAAASHTGAITGSDDVHSAAFKQFGLIRVDDCSQLNQMAMLLRQRRWPHSRKAAAVAASGGHAVLFADLGASLGIAWPQYRQSTRQKLGELLPDFGVATNPTDLTTAATGSAKLFAQSLQTICDDDEVDFMVPIFTANSEAEIRVGAELIRTASKPAAMLWTGKCSNQPELTPAILAGEGIPVFRDVLPCLQAVSAAMDYGKFLGDERVRRAKAAMPVGYDLTDARKLLADTEREVLGERISKQVLTACGFDLSSGSLARTAEEAVAIAAHIAGPVVLKIESPDIAHKTEVGGVELGLTGAHEVDAAFREIMARVARHCPSAAIQGVLVQAMAPPGVDLMIGISQDITFGPIVSVGLGGIHVEVFRDIAHGIGRVDGDQALAMLRTLRAFPILDGVRGTKRRDIRAVADLIVRMSWLAHDLATEIVEVDLNPVRVFEEGRGVEVLDALIVRRSTASR